MKNLFILVGVGLLFTKSCAQYGVIIIGDDLLAGVTGKNYTFQCQQTLQGRYAPTLEWEFSGNITTDNDKYSVTNDQSNSTRSTTSTLTIKNAQLQDAGEYTCHGHDRGSHVEATLQLTPGITVTITDEGGMFILAVGTKIGCMVDSLVEGSDDYIQWSKDGTNLMKGKQDITGDSVDDLEVTDDSIVFLSADGKIAGEYKCTKNLTNNIEVSAVQTIGNCYTDDKCNSASMTTVSMVTFFGTLIMMLFVHLK